MQSDSESIFAFLHKVGQTHKSFFHFLLLISTTFWISRVIHSLGERIQKTLNKLCLPNIVLVQIMKESFTARDS